MTADEQRTYSSEEFALILREAAELSSRTDQPGSSTEGLTLAEMKSAAVQAGLDPAFVERAARKLAMRTTASTFERVIGGPLRHEHDARFRVKLNEDSAARVLSAVRLNTDFHSSNPGDSGALGMMWKASGDGNVLSVVARPDADGTSVSVVIDRRGTFVLTGVVTFIAMFAALVVTTGVNSAAPALAPWTALAGIGGAIASARSFWASSSRKAQERIGAIIGTIGQTLAQDESEGTTTDSHPHGGR
ncbi:MAG: hypothetical protein ABMA00_17355 [Gemmatimonas sp.]